MQQAFAPKSPNALVDTNAREQRARGREEPVQGRDRVVRESRITPRCRLRRPDRGQREVVLLADLLLQAPGPGRRSAVPMKAIRSFQPSSPPALQLTKQFKFAVIGRSSYQPSPSSLSSSTHSGMTGRCTTAGSQRQRQWIFTSRGLRVSSGCGRAGRGGAARSPRRGYWLAG